ncbi:MAG TPA: DUF748 domain-containing protein [bacterium]|nr:DUF748 domain-containing protein [bacterium]
MKKTLFVLSVIFCILLLFMVVVDRVVGKYLEPRIENLLTDLFGMTVTIEDLRVNPFLGLVTASRITFMNQPEFADKPHLDGRGLIFDINLLALRHHQVKIRRILFDRLFYFIDRIATPEGPDNNVSVWVDHIREKTRGTDSAEKDKTPPSEPWLVKIGKIEINDGVFMFIDRSKESPNKKFFFQDIRGYLSGFKWPTADPAYLSQEVKLRGKFGYQYPAPFWIQGYANFSSRHVSFDLNGEVKGGRVVEHRAIWEGLPVQLVDGTFDLKSHTLCLERELDSQNELIIKSIKLKAGPQATDKIWGYPLKGWIAFLQDQQTLRLEIPIRGDIGDPKFKFYHAVRKSFQDGLKQKTQSGFRFLSNGAGMIVGGTQKLAVQTPQLVLDTPGKIVSGLGKMTSRGKTQGEDNVEDNVNVNEEEA